MLAYGWVFHMGFFNFYLSMGLCFWAMRLAWDRVARRKIPAMAALLIAGIPCACAARGLDRSACSLYSELARRVSAVGRAYLTAAFVLAMFGAASSCSRRLLVTRWSPSQLR